MASGIGFIGFIDSLGSYEPYKPYAGNTRSLLKYGGRCPTRKGEQRHKEGYTQPVRVVAAGLVCLNARAFGMPSPRTRATAILRLLYKIEIGTSVVASLNYYLMSQ
jgi:hypothetical protein